MLLCTELEHFAFPRRNCCLPPAAPLYCSVWGNLVDGYGNEAKRLKRRGIPLLSLQNKCGRLPHCLVPSAGHMPSPSCPASCFPAACPADHHCRHACCLACRMVWWVGCPLALATAAFVLYGWAGLTFAVGQALIR